MGLPAHDLPARVLPSGLRFTTVPVRPKTLIEHLPAQKILAHGIRTEIAVRSPGALARPPGFSPSPATEVRAYQRAEGPAVSPGSCCASHVRRGSVVCWLLAVPTCSPAPYVMATHDRAVALDRGLINVASRGSLDDVESFLNEGASVEACDENGRTALHLAAMSGSRPCIDLLLQWQASIDAPDANNCTPLHLASITGHQQCVSLLISRGANMNAEDRRSRTPLHFAAFNNQHQCIALLLEGEADINSLDSDGSTALHLAAFDGNYESIKALLDGDASINAPDSSGSTPLHLAAYKGHHPCVELLLQRRANPDSRDRDGVTPLHDAATADQTPCVQLLVGWGADSSITDVRVNILRLPLYSFTNSTLAVGWSCTIPCWSTGDCSVDWYCNP